MPTWENFTPVMLRPYTTSRWARFHWVMLTLPVARLELRAGARAQGNSLSAAISRRRHGHTQGAQGVLQGRSRPGLGKAARLSGGDRAAGARRLSRREEPARFPHAALALRCGCLYYR